jgi:Uma2 family endonuclease
MGGYLGMPVAMQNPWTRESCTGLLELGRYELIGGELVLKPPKSRGHMVAALLLGNWLLGVYGALFVPQCPSIDVHPEDNPTNDPAPDVAVLRRSIRELSAIPGPEDLVFVAEVASTTLSFDLTVKAGLYARAGIAEYWVVDVAGRRVIVHRRPEDGLYRDVAAYGAGERVATLGAPEQTILVEELF